MESLPTNNRLEPPLCVDLDGTLINTDLLMESIFILLRQAPVTIILLAPFWLARGKAYLKEQLVRRVQIDVSVLPYHATFLAYLHRLHTNGRRLILATASHFFFAKQIADHLEIFETVIATENGKNLSRALKGEYLAAAYGEHGFDYAGNSRADLAVWPRARAAILVNPVFGVESKVRMQIPITAVFDDRQGAWRIYLKTLRLHCWLINLLIFVPLLLTDSFLDAIIPGGLAFLTFSLGTSSVYILSDLLNLATDRQLPHKRHYSFVAGTMSIIHGAVLIPVLLVMALVLAVPLSPAYIALLLGYYLVSLAYLLNSKYIMLLDIIIQAALYTTRLIGGSIAMEVTISWPLLFILFLTICGILLAINAKRTPDSI